MAPYRSDNSLPIGLHYSGPRGASFARVVLVGAGFSAYSDDGGATWSVGGALPGGVRSMVAFAPNLGTGSGRLLTVETGADVRYSDDAGLTWLPGSAPSRQWRAVDWSEPIGRFMGVGSSGLANQRAMTSADGGVTFVTSPSVAALNWRCIQYVNAYGFFVAASVGTGLQRIMTSSDGFSWVDRGLTPVNGIQQNGFGYMPSVGKIVTINLNNNAPMFSNDGITFTSSPSLTPVTAVGGALVISPVSAIAYSAGATSYITVDGETWNPFATPIPVGGAPVPIHVGGRLILVNASAPHEVIASDNNGANWSLIGTAPNQGGNYTGGGACEPSLAA